MGSKKTTNVKNQYFGDINDYGKYGLLRSILNVGEFRMLVAWMLTPDDGGTDGKSTAYLDKPEKWSKHDSALFSGLGELLGSSDKRSVKLIEQTNLLPNAKYFSEEVPDSRQERDKWANTLFSRAEEFDFVFLDPDNGLEVKSKPYGRKNSSKYLYWQEVAKLWSKGKSLLIYQHFPKKKRHIFIQEILQTLESYTPRSAVEAFSTPYVVFLLALQPKHSEYYQPLLKTVRETWGNQLGIGN